MIVSEYTIYQDIFTTIKFGRIVKLYNLQDEI